MGKRKPASTSVPDPVSSSMERLRSGDEIPSFNMNSKKTIQSQMKCLRLEDAAKNPQSHAEEIRTTPIFSPSVYETTVKQKLLPEFALLAGVIKQNGKPDGEDRLFVNTNAPWSAFICGSQGSGKSYSLSCMLENCLSPTPTLGILTKPLAGLVFHYDEASAGADGLPCEAAYLSSLGIKTQVLVSISNYPSLKATYAKLNPDIQVKALKIAEKDLNMQNIQTLMADTRDGRTPLYMQMVYKILRRMNWESHGSGVDYSEFKATCLREIENPFQRGPLEMRLDLIEEFVRDPRHISTREKYPIEMADEWTPKAGELFIVDLSDPQINSEMACSMFEICLGIYQKQKPDVGKVIVMDEAHKYMTDGSSAGALTEALKTAIRMQRHRNMKIIVATQEPTISEALLDLCSITLIHRFSSPAWYTVLKGHLAAIADGGHDPDGSDAYNEQDGAGKGKQRPDRLFLKIASLNAGEALLCAPTAMLGLVKGEGESKRPQKLGTGYVKIRIRERLSKDGGQSLMANKDSRKK